ncbi:MAG: hypothetical protein RSF68_05005 [Myroides sp.]
MGRRNETNRLAYKKKVDQKKNKASNAEALRKEKLKQIQQQFNQQNNQDLQQE